MQRHGLVRKHILTDVELKEIEGLAAICEKRDGIEMRLNWSMLRMRSGNAINDFLYYEEGVLLGYLALYSFSRREAEMTGMVHPDHRQQGIFRALFGTANEECKQRGIPKLVMFFDNTSSLGKAFANAVGAEYRSSEYKMELFDSQRPQAVDLLGKRLHIRRAKPEDIDTLAYITGVAFDMAEDDVKSGIESDIPDPDRYLYLAELDGKPIGQINVSYSQGAFIYGFGVLPEYRGRGYGRTILAWTVEQALADKRHPIALEVAPENKNALSLYYSCGFKEIRTFDYYEIDVR